MARVLPAFVYQFTCYLLYRKRIHALLRRLGLPIDPLKPPVGTPEDELFMMEHDLRTCLTAEPCACAIMLEKYRAYMSEDL